MGVAPLFFSLQAWMQLWLARALVLLAMHAPEQLSDVQILRPPAPAPAPAPGTLRRCGWRQRRRAAPSSSRRRPTRIPSFLSSSPNSD